jgi:hypothetical protein
MGKQIPMLYSTPMVKALLDGRKTMTRRLVKFNKPIEVDQIGFTAFCNDGQFAVRGKHGNVHYGESLFNMPYRVGDVIWVRERFETETDGRIRFYASNPEVEHNAAYRNLTKWKPSIHMPKAAARIWLKITNVRVERLHDITRSDIRREGLVCPDELCSDDRFPNYRQWYPQAWKDLWIKLNGKDSFESNPWVWVIEFERIEKPA